MAENDLSLKAPTSLAPTDAPSPQGIAFQRKAWILVAVAALGYFVDIYDLILFSVVRVESLKGLGLPEQAVLAEGVKLINLQMFGMILGGIFFGIMGDRTGRLSVLFGSILLYSVANIANAFVHDTYWYGILRFIAGFGLAGELGAGITLVTETLPKHLRGWGATLVSAVGVTGAICAWLVATSTDWRTAYIVGGVMGLSLLLLRVGVAESHIFENLRTKAVSRGNFLLLFTSWSRLSRFVGCVMVGMPLWYTIGILVTLTPEFARELGIQGVVDGGRAIFFCYAGQVIGDLSIGFLSQTLKARKRAIRAFLWLLLGLMITYFRLQGVSAEIYYYFCLCLGVASGYWAMFATVAAEQFGTNLRATAATSAPNFVRGSLVLINSAFLFLKPSLGTLEAAFAVGVVVFAVAFVGLSMMHETFALDLNYEEPC